MYENKEGCNILAANINTIEGEMISLPPKPLNFNLKEKIEAEIDRLESVKYIKKSNSKWNTPLRVVEKKNRKIRITIDARQLNKITIEESYQFHKYLR